MLIVSQDKCRIVNYDKIIVIEVYRDPNRDMWLIEARDVTSKYVILGLYQTKEEALSVLEAIQNSYKLENSGTKNYCYIYSIAERKLL